MTAALVSRVSVVVLAKHADHAKSRLGLPPEEARRTALGLASSTVRTALAAESVGTVLVVTSDPDIASDALEAGAQVVDEGRPLGINMAAVLGRREAFEASPNAPVAILVADLPYLRPQDIDAAVAEFTELDQPLFVADRHGSGTTFLIHSRGQMMGMAFGHHSASMHRRLGYGEARLPERGLRVDLDTAEDLKEMARLLGV